MSGFNIQGIDFSKLPDSFKVDIDTDNFAPNTINALKNGDKPVDLSDKEMSKQDAENFYVELDADQSFTIDDNEIIAYARNKGIEGKESEIKEIINATLEEIRTQSEENNENKTETEDIKVSVQKWGSTPTDDNKYANDCLRHIMQNHYPDLEPNSDEWNAKELEIMNANPAIYGTVDDEGNVTGARKAVGGEGRHNAVLYDTDELVLPGIKSPETEETDEDGSEEDNSDPANDGLAPQESVTRDDGTTDTNYKNDNDLVVKSEHKDANGTLLDTTEYKYNENSVKIEEIQTKFDAEGKKTEKTAYAFAEDGTTILRENIYTYKEDSDTPIPTKERTYNSDRSYQERTYKDNGKSMSAQYDANGNIQPGTEKYYDDMGNEITKEVYEQE